MKDKERKELEDKLAKLIESILIKYKKSLFKKGYGEPDKIDFRNFAAYDIAKIVINEFENKVILLEAEIEGLSSMLLELQQENVKSKEPRDP